MGKAATLGSASFAAAGGLKREYSHEAKQTLEIFEGLKSECANHRGQRFDFINDDSHLQQNGIHTVAGFFRNPKDGRNFPVIEITFQADFKSTRFFLGQDVYRREGKIIPATDGGPTSHEIGYAKLVIIRFIERYMHEHPAYERIQTAKFEALKPPVNQPEASPQTPEA